MDVDKEAIVDPCGLDFNDERVRGAFFTIHSDLPREGPGDDVSSLRAFDMIKHLLPDKPVVYDLGCGPGQQTCVLARALKDCGKEPKIVCVDLFEHFLQQAKSLAEKSGFGDIVTTRVGDFSSDEAFGDDHGKVDLIWCEGAAYNLGIEKALKTWKKHLKPNGVIAFTEPTKTEVWKDDVDVPEPVVETWAEYPALTRTSGVLEWIKNAEFKVVGEPFDIPLQSWFTQYYDPISVKLNSNEIKEKLLSEYEADGIGKRVYDILVKEVDVARKYGEYVAYTFFCVSTSK